MDAFEVNRAGVARTVVQLLLSIFYSLFSLFLSSFLGALGALAVESSSFAAPPVVRNIDRLGLQAGGTTALTIDGENLLPEPKVLLSAPVEKQVVQPKGTANRVVI